MCLGERRLAGEAHFRRIALELRKVAAGTEHEHAAVPEVLAGGDVGLGAGEIRLLDKGGDTVDSTLRFAAPDVAIAGLGLVRHDAEGDELAVARCAKADLDRLVEALDVADHVVGRHHQQHRIGTVRRSRADRRQRGHRDGRRRVTADGLEDDRRRLAAHPAQLLGDDEAMLLVADNDSWFGGKPRESPDRVLDHRQFADQGQELLGVEVARQWPQAGA